MHGFDLSPGMLARARRNVPGATFARARYTALPLADGSADHMVCTLALSHAEHVGPFFAEAARVLRPGGHLLIADTRGHFLGSPLYPIVKHDRRGGYGYVRNWCHPTGDYVRASIEHGFAIRACEEPQRPRPTVLPGETPEDPGVPPDVWLLHPWVPAAANAARDGHPALIVWDLELTGATRSPGADGRGTAAATV
ncbi:hypothetical protein Ade02nite_33230 [Paractinoplanes deccanensis]|uniref:Methyltransferase type 11 domain-containing protein n=1 Tax=Paractinoplanes deccanensis TaxID=113561 RepID=A0ABQ3Y3V7_9ACTN|nr:hypothetical protein Ade02nite_33230 [Actinoplanes deccanensis]